MGRPFAMLRLAQLTELARPVYLEPQASYGPPLSRSYMNKFGNIFPEWEESNFFQGIFIKEIVTHDSVHVFYWLLKILYYCHKKIFSNFFRILHSSLKGISLKIQAIWHSFFFLNR